MSVEKVFYDTFVNYRKFRWLWISLAFLVGATVVYIVNDPPGGRNGGTVVGIRMGPSQLS